MADSNPLIVAMVLTKDQERELREVSEERNVSLQQIVLESIGTYLTLRHQQDEGWTLLLLKDGVQRTVALS